MQSWALGLLGIAMLAANPSVPPKNWLERLIKRLVKLVDYLTDHTTNLFVKMNGDRVGAWALLALAVATRIDPDNFIMTVIQKQYPSLTHGLWEFVFMLGFIRMITIKPNSKLRVMWITIAFLSPIAALYIFRFVTAIQMGSYLSATAYLVTVVILFVWSARNTAIIVYRQQIISLQATIVDLNNQLASMKKETTSQG